MIDGSTQSNDLDKTEANKTLIRNFVDDILKKGKMEKLAGYYNGDNYIQHNPLIPDQLSGLGKALDQWAKQGITMKYDKVHKVLGEGHLAICSGLLQRPAPLVAILMSCAVKLFLFQ
jgi:predicted SnoaL-like aldol condensation-catalyzing enzyme